jgi:hypothetical protein
VGGDGSAGIGGSWSFDNGTVIIEGGTVNATGGRDGAGIGGGYAGSGGTITINYPSGTSAGAARTPGGYDKAGGYGRAVGPGAVGSGGSFNGVEGNWPPDTESKVDYGHRTYEW